MQFLDAHLYRNGAWEDFNGFGDNVPAYYGLEGLNTRDFRIWDLNCTF